MPNKQTILAILAVTLVFLIFQGCGASQTLTRGCGGDLDMLCDMIFGYDSEQIDSNEDDIEELQDQIELLIEQISQLDSVQDQVTELEALLDGLYSLENAEALQDQVDDLAADLSSIQLETRIIDLYDPCGDDPGEIDEVLLQASDGRWAAYFQQGSRRMIAVLPPGSYQTTDNQKCRFEITNSGSIVNERD